MTPSLNTHRFDRWNYRVCVKGNPRHGVWHSIIECYYDKDGNILAWCEAEPGGDTPGELSDDLNLMALAVQRAYHGDGSSPVLVYDELPHE